MQDDARASGVRSCARPGSLPYSRALCHCMKDYKLDAAASQSLAYSAGMPSRFNSSTLADTRFIAGQRERVP